MNPLFYLPLHGVFCAPFCGSEKHDLPIEITLDFTNDNLDSHFSNIGIHENKSAEPLWSMVDKGERYHSEVNLYKTHLHESDTSNSDRNNSDTNNCYYLHVNCQGRGLFKITKNTITINWQAEGTGADHYFQTLAIALNLELNNVLCIHANALAYKDKAIAIVAPSRTGKTTLTAALSQQGFALMTDDMVALHLQTHGQEHRQTHGQEHEQDQKRKVEQSYTIYPSWPVVRMWPDSLKDIPFAESEEHQEHQKVHKQFEKRTVNLAKTKAVEFCDQPKKLQVIYLLNRLPQEQTKKQKQEQEQTDKQHSNTPVCEIVPIGTAQALILLLQNSILGSCYSALKLEKSRVKAFSTLLENIAFKQINYPSGKEHLNEIGEMIKKDLRA